MSVIKEYEVNEGLLVITNTLRALVSQYSFELPEDIKNKIIKFNYELMKEIEKEYDKEDIEDSKLIDKVEFKDKNSNEQ